MHDKSEPKTKDGLKLAVVDLPKTHWALTVETSHCTLNLFGSLVRFRQPCLSFISIFIGYDLLAPSPVLVLY